MFLDVTGYDNNTPTDLLTVLVKYALNPKPQRVFRRHNRIQIHYDNPKDAIMAVLRGAHVNGRAITMHFPDDVRYLRFLVDEQSDPYLIKDLCSSYGEVTSLSFATNPEMSSLGPARETYVRFSDPKNRQRFQDQFHRTFGKSLCDVVPPFQKSLSIRATSINPSIVKEDLVRLLSPGTLVVVDPFVSNDATMADVYFKNYEEVVVAMINININKSLGAEATAKLSWY